MNEVIEHKRCIYCGHSNPAEVVECTRCQAYLPDESDVLAEIHFSPRRSFGRGGVVRGGGHTIAVKNQAYRRGAVHFGREKPKGG